MLFLSIFTVLTLAGFNNILFVYIIFASEAPLNTRSTSCHGLPQTPVAVQSMLRLPRDSRTISFEHPLHPAHPLDTRCALSILLFGIICNEIIRMILNP